MSSLKKRFGGRYRIGFCWQGERRYHSLGKLSAQDAQFSLNRLEESLCFIERGLLDVPPDGDLGHFLVKGGRFKAKPVHENRLTLADLLARYQAEQMEGVKEDSTRAMEFMDMAHLLRIIGAPTCGRSRRKRLRNM